MTVSCQTLCDACFAGHWLVKREDLQAVLYDAAVADGAVVSFNKNVKTVDEEKPAAHLDDGSSVPADLIIAADGNVSPNPETSD